jgi:hypothetical protein
MTARHASPAELHPQTLEAWQTYRTLSEARMEQELASSRGFLVQDFLPDGQAAACRKLVESGGICVQQMETLDPDGKPVEVPKGLIHHWMAAVLVPGAELDGLLGWVQDYDQHHKYFDEVVGSRLLSHAGDSFKISLLLKRTKVITVYYRAEMDVVYRRHGPDRASSRSVSTRLAELEDFGTDEQREKPPGHDGGYLWRLNSYWRFERTEDGVLVSCESISLSRGVPLGLGKLIDPIINSLPRESLEGMLGSIRDKYRPRAEP